MKLKVRYFGMITEWAGTDSETVDVEGTSVKELKARLTTTIPLLDSISYQVAVNQNIASEETELTENDEVAVLPPFAGG